MTLDEALAECAAVAILRGVRPDEVVGHAEALFAAGIRVVEVPLNSPDPLESLSRLAKALAGRMICGAGTVITIASVEAVRAAGGEIVVSPNTDPEVIRRTIALGMAPVPGFATATEAFAALGAGARILKLFPAGTYGPSHMKQLSAVLPGEARVLAVGGIGAGDFAVWRAAGAAGFGLGSSLYQPGQTPEATFEAAKAVVAALNTLESKT